jgi:type VI secretion system secreted protein Hcp
MAFDIFMNLKPASGSSTPPTLGESLDGEFKDWIEVRSIEFGAENPTAIASTGGFGAGKVKFQFLTIEKSVDRASPALFRACASGQHYDVVTIAIRTVGTPSGKPYLIYKFKTVFVSELNWAGSGGDDNPAETVSFAYGVMQISYATQSPTGQLATPQLTNWSQITNTAEAIP